MTTTVSAKIPDEMKEEIDQEGINVSEVVRKALDDELTRRRRVALCRDADTLSDRLAGRVDTEDVTTAVRETRDEN